MIFRHMNEAHHIEALDEIAFFTLHDMNNDGFLDDHEIRAIYGLERGISGDASHVNAIVRRAFFDLDRDGDGLISKTEYMQFHLPDWTEAEIRADKQWQVTHGGQQVMDASHGATDSSNSDHDEPSAQWVEHDDEIDQELPRNEENTAPAASWFTTSDDHRPVSWFSTNNHQQFQPEDDDDTPMQPYIPAKFQEL
ncbi:hypothetical protein BC940DRAFT_312711 [Gongronella butleri]|nr:hypothetical protein BC940DRAFT_312711 [Gongronella butleri]